ncbi:MAG: hypothetical protein ACYCZU_02330 [Devosia sp.]
MDDAFEDLSHGLRVLLEADWRAHQGGLLLVDRAEAVGNIENANSAVLNAFHSLYDAMEKEIRPSVIDWYRSGPLVTILALRNARHHNKARKIRTLYSFHAQEAAHPGQMEQYVLLNFPFPDETADTFDLYVSWSDLDDLLTLPRTESHMFSAACDLVREYLGSSKFVSYAAYYQLPVKRVFINAIPLIVNAASTVVPFIKDRIQGRSTESETYKMLFEDMEMALTRSPEVNCGPFALP